ncbi:hypothetical protein FRB99_008307 [Tulasnella sp. 403]|nr:hypothetical protein FRB99_008307 [Tulasnella sp. 403]
MLPSVPPDDPRHPFHDFQNAPSNSLLGHVADLLRDAPYVDVEVSNVTFTTRVRSIRTSLTLGASVSEDAPGSYLETFREVVSPIRGTIEMELDVSRDMTLETLACVEQRVCRLEVVDNISLEELVRYLCVTRSTEGRYASRWNCPNLKEVQFTCAAENVRTDVQAMTSADAQKLAVLACRRFGLYDRLADSSAFRPSPTGDSSSIRMWRICDGHMGYPVLDLRTKSVIEVLESALGKSVVILGNPRDH